MKALLPLVMLGALLSACAVQGTWAPHVRSPVVAVGTFGGRLIGTRSNGAYGSGDVVVGLPHNGSFSLRHALVGSGYRHVWRLLSLELGADLGMGEPAYQAWDGTGLYMGPSIGVLARVLGHQDTEVGYSPVGLLADLVLQLRGGVWNPPAGSDDRPLADASIQLGIRISLISDLPVSINDNWEP